MLYFAYGSNMDWPQMQLRCPTTRFVGRATLRDRQLAFTRLSSGRGCGVADVVRAPGHKVWGVVYDVAESDVATLDGHEGFHADRAQNAYWRRECSVHIEDDDRQPLTVASYFATSQADAPLPNRIYLQHLISGARHWRLPDTYIEQLESINTAG
jgi:hypothetical protein